MIRLAAIVAMAALPIPAAAAQATETAITLPFAPPTGRPMRYEMTQVRTEAGSTVRSTAVREVRFDPESDGFTMTMRLSEATTDATGRTGDNFRDAMAALTGIDFTFRVARSGTVGALVNFKAVRARLAATRGSGRADATIERLLALPDARLDRMIRLDAEQLLAYAGRQVDTTRPDTASSPRASPLGGTVDVTRTSRWTLPNADIAIEQVEHRSGDAALRDLIVALNAQRGTATDPATRAQLDSSFAAIAPMWFEETTETRVSRHWGLPVEAKRRTRLLSPAGDVQIEETRRFGDFLR